MRRWLYIPAIFIASLISQLAVTAHVMATVEGFESIGFPTTFERAQQVAKLFQANLDHHYYTLLVFQLHSFLL
jgi:hypothetical protein